MCQTGGLMWLMSADRQPRPTAALRPMISHTRHPVGNRVPPSHSQHVLRHVWYGARRRPAVSCTHPAHDVDRLSSGVRRGEALIPRPVVRWPMATALPGSRSPCTLPRPFWMHHRPLRRWRWVPSLARNGAGSSRRSTPPPLRAPTAEAQAADRS